MANNRIIPVSGFPSEDGAQIIDAIRNGCVDAFVVEERDGQAVYTLNSGDLPYSTLVQRMQQGAAMIDAAGLIIYNNSSLAAVLGISQAMVGLRFDDLVAADDKPKFRALLQEQHGSREAELRLCRSDDALIPVRVSLTALSRDTSVIGVLVTDLTSEKSYAELASRIQSVEDQERKKIARELHDSVGQLLAALAMNVSRLTSEAVNLPSTFVERLTDCGALVDQVSREIRTISYLLHPPLLDIAGLSSAVRWYVDGFSHRSNISVNVDIDADLGRLPAEVEISLFRVIQECLTNVYRHSGGKSCSISMRHDAGSVRLEVADTGHGMKTAPLEPGVSEDRPSGVGLRGMRERLRPLGGTLKIDSGDKGTVVKVVVPLAEDLQDEKAG